MPSASIPASQTLHSGTQLRGNLRQSVFHAVWQEVPVNRGDKLPNSFWQSHNPKILGFPLYYVFRELLHILWIHSFIEVYLSGVYRKRSNRWSGTLKINTCVCAQACVFHRYVLWRFLQILNLSCHSRYNRALCASQLWSDATVSRCHVFAPCFLFAISSSSNIWRSMPICRINK